MKKLHILITGLLLFASCKKSFLELTPPSIATTNAFYKTSTDAITAVNGCYADLHNEYSSEFIVLMENRGDNVVDFDASSSSGVNYVIAHFTDDAGNSVLYSTWVTVYNAVFHCNNVLANIGGIKMDNTLKNRVLAEARFLRGFQYFNLVRLWGAVPLDTTTLTLSQAYALKRNDVNTIYAQIESDLNFAAANLPASYTGADVGRATSGAANGLLGKVYLYEKKYTNANTALQGVIGSNVFSLQPNIANVFSDANKYNPEILFAVRYASGVTGQTHGYWYNDAGFPQINPSIQNAYTSSDLRKPLVNAVKIAGTTNTATPAKFTDAPDASGNSGCDFPVLRYADIYLMQAEVMNEQAYNADTSAGTAFYYLNRVLNRAGLNSLSSTDLPNQTAFRAEIYTQRRLELPFECDRWFDLVRTGQAIAAIQADPGKFIGNTPLVIDAHRFIYPMPNQEITIMNNPANFGQNPGY